MMNLVEFQEFLSAHPLTKITRTKFNALRTTKKQYRQCRCNCGYLFAVGINIAENTYITALHHYPSTTLLMCFFHVQKNAKDRLRKLGSNQEVQAEIKSDIADVHSTVNEDTFNSMYQEKERKWVALAPAGFASYFRKQWIDGDFTNWKVFNGDAEVAATNNALESFNKTIKKMYTHSI